MSEPINWCDLKKNIKHIGEVSTSHRDGAQSGADILTSTNEVTGQVRDTLAGKLKKFDTQLSKQDADFNANINRQDQIFQDRFSVLEPVEWTAETEVTNPLQVYKHTVAGVERTYLADPALVPFTTEASFADDAALNRWVADDVLTTSRSALVFDTVELMKSSLALENGQLVFTKGYAEKGDGGEAVYLITRSDDFDFLVDGFGDHELANGLVAVLTPSGSVVTSKMYGMVDVITQNAWHDYTPNLQAMYNASVPSDRGAKPRLQGMQVWTVGYIGVSTPITLDGLDGNLVNNNSFFFDCYIKDLAGMSYIMNITHFYRDVFYGTLKLQGHNTSTNFNSKDTLYGLFLQGISGCRMLDICVNSIKKWGVVIRGVGASDGNYKARVGTIQAWNCGLAWHLHNDLSAGVINVVSGTATGSTSTKMQSALPLVNNEADSPFPVPQTTCLMGVAETDAPFGGLSVFTVEKERDGRTLEFRPTLTDAQIALIESGNLQEIIGGAVLVHGKENASMVIDGIFSINCAHTIQDTSLYNTTVGTLQSEFCSVGAVSGVQSINSLYCEATNVHALYIGHSQGDGQKNLKINDAIIFRYSRIFDSAVKFSGSDDRPFLDAKPKSIPQRSTSLMRRIEGTYTELVSRHDLTHNLHLGITQVIDYQEITSTLTIRPQTSETIEGEVQAGCLRSGVYTFLNSGSPKTLRVSSMPATPQNYAPITVNGGLDHIYYSIPTGGAVMYYTYSPQTNNMTFTLVKMGEHIANT